MLVDVIYYPFPSFVVEFRLLNCLLMLFGVGDPFVNFIALFMRFYSVEVNILLIRFEDVQLDLREVFVKSNWKDIQDWEAKAVGG